MQKGKRARNIQLCLAYQRLRTKRKVLKEMHCDLTTLNNALDWLKGLSPQYVAKLESIFDAKGLCGLQEEPLRVRKATQYRAPMGFLVPVGVDTTLWTTKAREDVRWFTYIYLEAREGPVLMNSNPEAKAMTTESDPWQIHIAYWPYGNLDSPSVTVLKDKKLRIDIMCSLPWKDPTLARQIGMETGEVQSEIVLPAEPEPDMFWANPVFLSDRGRRRTFFVPDGERMVRVVVYYATGKTKMVLRLVRRGFAAELEILDHKVHRY